MKKHLIKRLLSKRNNGGFTLVEVIVSCALLSILVLGVMGFVGPVMNMVKINQKNARATMLAETINSYISGCLRNANKVEVFTLSDVGDAMQPEATHLRSKAGGLNNIDAFLLDGTNMTDYELHCLGVTWMAYSTSTGSRYKLVLSNCLVNTKATISTSSGNIYKLGYEGAKPQVEVFDDALYTGLYPIIDISNFSTTKDAEGNYVGANANGLKVETKVYSDDKCYNVLPAERAKSHLAFVGTSFIEFVNMKGTPASNVIPMADDLQDAIDGHTTLTYTVGDHSFYYPSTYIYYLVPKK